jgi:glycosyltransferase involved in cell wall biosynthesis
MAEASLVISFYNRVDYLSLIFAALEKQSFKHFEVIIADDGSSEENTLRLEQLSRQLNYPMKHLWHEDKGFRKNIILNRSIVESAADYIIFIDGDCIPHPEFINEHVKNRKDNQSLTGRRVNLSRELTELLTTENIKEGYPEKLLLRMFSDSIRGGTKDAEKGMYIKNGLLRSFFNRKDRGVLGCNFSANKNDLLNVNGFDERYIAPSIGEDSDIEFRLRLNGVHIKSINNIAVQYHLFHKLQPRLQQNIDLYSQVVKERKSFTEYGIKKLQNA